MRVLTALTVVIMVACGTARSTGSPVPASPREATTEELVRTRCSLDGHEVITTWTGTMFAFVPNEAPRRLFDLVGMNVARCLRETRGWHMTSRELMYYLDPVTHAVIHRWTNPWTGEVVPVVHVANARVQMPLSGLVPLRIAGSFATIVLDVPLAYPSPFGRDERFAAFGGPFYQAGEFFALTTSSAAIADVRRAEVPEMVLEWNRVGPWLPWMKQADRTGWLVYSAHGQKVASLAELPAVLRDEIATRLPRFQHAPVCVVEGSNETSWTYFAEHVARYLAGERFPLPSPVQPETCRGQ